MLGFYFYYFYCSDTLAAIRRTSCMAAAPACDFTPQPRATVWKSHCGLGGLGGCVVSSHGNKCCWCGCEWRLLCRSLLGGIVLRQKQSHSSSPSYFHSSPQFWLSHTHKVCCAGQYQTFIHLLGLCKAHVQKVSKKKTFIEPNN